MAIEDRILYLVRQEVKEVADAIGAPGWSEHISDLHRELHELATRVAHLEELLLGDKKAVPVRSPRKAPTQ